MGTKNYQKINNFFSLSYNQNRIFGLDLLRAFSILVVMSIHGQWFVSENIRHIQQHFLVDGVAIFFILSGFLVGNILIKDFSVQKISFKIILSFWVKRWLRTLPVYYLCLSFLICISIVFLPNFRWQEKIIYYLFLQNLNRGLPSFYPETWSLCVEEWFYFIIPLFLLSIHLLLQLNNKQTFLITILFFLFLTIYLRIIVYLEYENKQLYFEAIRYQVFMRLDGILYGFLGAWISYYYKKIWIKYKYLGLYAGLFIFFMEKFNFISYYILLGDWYWVFCFNIFSLEILLILPYLSEWKKCKGYLAKFITYTSILSYSLYLVHFALVKEWLVMPKVRNYYDIPFIPYFLEAFILYWVGSYVISFIVYKYYEYPIIEWRNKKCI
jgi:peptidoglycan/LPS O-acetylase OafA/YrhL